METTFNFFQHWYPLIPVEDLDPQRPKALTLLGLRLVIWKPGCSDRYRVFLDQCPHRLAPLSEGRIDEKTGHLMCSYHGWQFDPQGQCSCIPQADNPDLVAKNSQNFCAQVFPVQEANDLLWVWPEPPSSELAAQTPLPLSPQIDAGKGFVWSSMMRDLAYDWSTLIENVADPSHVSFAHHGVQGNRDRATPLPIEIVTATVSKLEAKIDQGLKSTITFEPPCRLEYEITFGSAGKKVGLITYCIPVAPGQSRIVAQFSRNFATQLQALIPRWWDHIRNRHLVLDGDMILLSQQEVFLKQKQQQESWKTAFKLPTQADRLVIEFRRWFDQYCDGKLPWPQVGLAEPDRPKVHDNRQDLLDRYHQHTQHCQSCQGALRWIKRWQWLLLGLFALAVTVAMLLPDRLRLTVGLPIMAIALAGLGVYSWLKVWLEPQFYFVDYVHAER